jgi:predicted deacylase
MNDHSITVCDTTIAPGSQAIIDLPISPLYTQTPMNIPVHVINGKKPGPVLLVCAAVHGDEINGVEIIRRLLKMRLLKSLHGTLIAVPIVNIFGFLYHSRYLPDRRDLNRSFPGSKEGSMASRMSYIFINEILAQCTHGIDFHTGGAHRTYLPQIHANLSKKATLRIAKAFGVPVLLDAKEQDNSLRAIAAKYKIPFLVYEAGEALRLDELSIRAGLRGVLNVMRELDMLKKTTHPFTSRAKPFIARSSVWVRSEQSGLFLSPISLGHRVLKKQILAHISDPISGKSTEVLAPTKGIIIGRNHLPLVNEGDALFQIARFEKSKKVLAQVKEFHSAHLDEDDSLSPGI